MSAEDYQEGDTVVHDGDIATVKRPYDGYNVLIHKHEVDEDWQVNPDQLETMSEQFVDEIDGVGETREEDLVEAGYETVGDVVDADPGDLEDAGLGTAAAEQIHSAATNLVSE